MCIICLQDFQFEWSAEPKIERKKMRILKIKSLLALAVDNEVCDNKIEELIEEQYKLSREF